MYRFLTLYNFIKTMKFFRLTTILLLFFCFGKMQTANAQSVQRPSQLYSIYYNFLAQSSKVDSVMFYHKKILNNSAFAENEVLDILFKDAVLNNLLSVRKNESSVDNKRKKLFLKEVLNRLEKEQIIESMPLILWTKASETNNLDTLKSITLAMIELANNSTDYYSNFIGRYCVGTYRIIKKYPELNELSARLFTILEKHLQENQVPLENATTRSIEYKRANLRYLYAYLNYDKASETKDIHERKQLLRKASEFSPDKTDIENQIAFSPDIQLLNSKQSFEEDYLNFLMNDLPNQSEALNSLIALSLKEPIHKERLKQFYLKSNTSTKTFETFWLEQIENSGKTVPKVSLTKFLNTQLSLKKEMSKKWILLDFWGTWCKPCIAEHPEIQKFYDSTIVKNADKFSLITIACGDTEAKVLKYMNEKKYTFPVLLSDDKIEKDFQVSGYPSKILITPNKKYIFIPFGEDWQKFIKKYTELW